MNKRELENKTKKLETKVKELETKLSFIADRLGYEELVGYNYNPFGISPLFYTEPDKLKKWDALLDYLKIEWHEEKKEGFKKK